MKKELVSLPDAEFEVMSALWHCNAEFVPTTEILAQMKTEKKAQTVLTMLTRLADKGFLSSRKNGKERLWKAEVSEEEYRSSEAKRIVEKVYGGSFVGLISAFYDGKGLSEADAEELISWLDKEKGKNG
ncbi:MAG: BlaI/MecI/CopY family transcriptional regulator [Clostridia bacterium]|nr:BlaI/MecI/CopY family transcriptional regulator [Clostridia bacterium]MBQ8861443.1 BlaI/MecI/CopY family transcriptional regulator [Clostridia bacterium]